jgi:hypothetical protein
MQNARSGYSSKPGLKNGSSGKQTLFFTVRAAEWIGSTRLALALIASSGTWC